MLLPAERASDRPKPSRLSGTQNLIGMFGLTSMYDEHVRPFYPSKAGNQQQQPVAATPAPAAPVAPGGIVFKFAGQAISTTSPAAPAAPAKPANQPVQKRNDKTYAHIVSDIMGRNRIKKDDHIERLVKDPSWFEPPTPLPKLDDETLRSAFTLQPGVIPGFDSGIWEKDANDDEASPPKRRKKKRKHGGSTDAAATGGTGIEQHDAKRRKAD